VPTGIYYLLEVFLYVSKTVIPSALFLSPFVIVFSDFLFF